MIDDNEHDEKRKKLALQQQLDQAGLILGEHLPGLWWRLYENSKIHGFKEEQAFDLLKTYILSQCPHGVNDK